MKAAHCKMMQNNIFAVTVYLLLENMIKLVSFCNLAVMAFLLKNAVLTMFDM